MQLSYSIEIAIFYRCLDPSYNISGGYLGFLKGGFQGSERVKDCIFFLKKGRHFHRQSACTKLESF